MGLTRPELQKSSQRTKTILLTRHDEDQLRDRGASGRSEGYVLKSQVATDLVRAIQDVCRGGFISARVFPHGRGGVAVQGGAANGPLTSRERQVLQLVGEGKSTKEVAALLGVSTKTAESHRNRLMGKLDIHETASLVRYAIRRGLLQP